MKKHSAQRALLAFALVFVLPASAEIYQWKDEQGRVHFSDIPPNQANVGKTISSTPARPHPVADDPEAAQPDGETAPANAIPAAAPAKSLAERDLEFRKRRAADAEARAKAEKDAAQANRRAQDCQRARIQHGALVSGQRVARPTADGGREFLDAGEREAEIARAQELVDAFCNEK
ncbi:MAG: DUF4124 domain-containing protein [Azoarcus sp.]|jgi:hypothetical protein|nr:DUF4124 domain-containing protein [Azoarcus sp.]